MNYEWDARLIRNNNETFEISFSAPTADAAGEIAQAKATATGSKVYALIYRGADPKEEQPS